MSDAPTPPLLTTRRMLWQVGGFLVGAALLAWCIIGAVRGGDWSKVASASPWLIAGLAASTVMSLAVNGALFWVTIRPVQRLGMWDLQLLNVTTGILNYAPVRAGLVARILFHLRVDRMGVLRMGAWFTTVIVLLGVSLGRA